MVTCAGGQPILAGLQSIDIGQANANHHPSTIIPQVILEIAGNHGDESERYCETEDLQVYLRAALALLTPEQGSAFLANPSVVTALEGSFPDIEEGAMNPVELYAHVEDKVALIARRRMG